MSKHIMFGFHFLEVIDASGVVHCTSFVNDRMVFGSMIVYTASLPSWTYLAIEEIFQLVYNGHMLVISHVVIATLLTQHKYLNAL